MGALEGAKRWDVARHVTLELLRASSQRDRPASISTSLTLSLRGWRDGCGRGGWNRGAASWFVVVKRDVEENVATRRSGTGTGRRPTQHVHGARA